MGSFKFFLFDVANNLWGISVVILALASHVLLGWLWFMMHLVRLFAVYRAKSDFKFGKALSWFDMSLWENYEIEHRGSILALFYLDGDITLEKFKQLFQENVLNAKLEEDPCGPLRYPELQQFQTTYLDFRFWKNDQDFSIDNHITEICFDECPGEKPNKLQNFLETVIGKPFPKKSSPWTLNVIRNFPDDKGNNLGTQLIFRAHHSLLDGLSIINIFSSGLGKRKVVGKGLPKLLAQVLEPSLGIKMGAKFLQGIYSSQKRNLFNTIFWKWRRVTRVGAGKVILRSTKGLPLEIIKILARKNQVTLPAFILSFVCHYLAKIRKSSVPCMYASYVMPLPNHPPNLTNHMQLGLIKLPVETRDNLKATMEEINDEIVELKSSSIPMVFRYFGYIGGSIFSTALTFIKKYMLFTPIMISNIAGDKDGFEVDGVPCNSVVSYLSPFDSALDATIVLYSYKGEIHVCFAIDDRFLHENQVTHLAKSVSEHLEKMIKEEMC